MCYQMCQNSCCHSNKQSMSHEESSDERLFETKLHHLQCHLIINNYLRSLLSLI